MAQEWIEQLGRRNRTSKTRRLYEDGQPTRKYSWDGVVGTSLHYPDAGGDWQDLDVNAEEPDTDGFTLKFTELPYFARIAEDGRRRIYLDRNDLSYWIEFGKPFPSMGTPSRFERWFYWDFPHARIGVRFDPDSIKFGFRLKNDHAPTSITIPFETQGITRVGRLLYHDGEVVGALRRPIATGSNLDAEGFPVQKDCDISFAPGEITISLDPTGLEYPIDIDPTVDKQVGAGADDGYCYDGVWKNALANLRYGRFDAKLSIMFARFTGVTIPAGSTIDANSHISLYGQPGWGVPETKLSADDQADPTAAGSCVDLIGRTKTTEKVDWDGLLTDNAWNNSPSIQDIIQELVDSYDYSSGSAIQMLLDNDNPVSELALGDVDSWSAEGDHSTGPKLHIEYTAAAAAVGFGIVV